MPFIKVNSIGSGTVRVMGRVNGVLTVSPPGARLITVLVDVNSTATIIAVPDPVVGIYDKWVNNISRSYVREVSSQGVFSFTAISDTYNFTCFFLNNTKIEPIGHTEAVDLIPLTGDVTVPIVKLGVVVPEDTNFDGTFMVGTCKCEPYIVSSTNRSWYRVKDNTGQEIYSGLSSSAVARTKAEGDSRCIKPYVDPTLSLLPVDQGKEKEKPKEDEGYGEIIIVAGIGLLAIAAIYLSRRKT